jgi:hypothetical protein
MSVGHFDPLQQSENAMRQFLMTTALSLLALPALAQDVAFLLGNDRTRISIVCAALLI